MIKTVLLDVDGTLMDTKEIFNQTLIKTLKRFGIKTDFDSSLFGMSVDQVMQKLKIVNLQEFKEYWEKEFAYESERCDFYPGIKETMEIIENRDIIIYLITSRSHSTVDYICNNSVLSPYITGCIAAEDTMLHKPNAEPINRALKLTNTKPCEAIYVGDTIQDYQASTSAGVRFALAGWNEGTENVSFNVLLNTPYALIDEIQKYNIEEN